MGSDFDIYTQEEFTADEEQQIMGEGKLRYVYGKFEPEAITPAYIGEGNKYRMLDLWRNKGFVRPRISRLSKANWGELGV
jgi:hypothetical protein